ncbi:Conserved TM helix [Zhouia amylolytica]|uniref:MscS Mechanosensitive ion channel n=2 Tax=Zhouia amylolytica TaxID=376730 RepID=W2UKL8_9FLAO|nr:mechanosensitive ion channel domain-containing protein [Zhouia amylolytica]ETN93991.1 MscS Mechanosensitive ion channel [Zhouia amylolytica AD3]MCQ0111389.1 mechanosensitive ion channel family protein [Zhouia amylolytica]SFS37230.1 Conserved TM helix [Zhouia amylolytica]
MKKATETIYNSLQEYYHQLLETIPRIFIGILIIIIGILTAKIISNFFRKRILKKTDDPLMARFLIQAFKISLILIASMLALEAAGLSNIATGILTAAGGAAIILGFAFQDIGKNFLSGIILAFNRPFNIDDTIKIEEMFGKVKALQFRYTHIKTFDGRDIYIPNADVLVKPVSNYTADGFLRNEFIVGIGYEDDIEQAKKIIQGVLDNNKLIVSSDLHTNFVAEDELAPSTVNLKVYFWNTTLDYGVSSLVLRGKIIQEVKQKLEEADFNLPADVKEIKLYKNQPDIPLKVKKDL